MLYRQVWANCTHTDEAGFREDVRSLLTGKYKLPDGRIVWGQAASFLLTEMRGMYGHSTLASGRVWRGLGTLGQFEDMCRKLGFEVAYGAYGKRITRGGDYKFCAKAVCVHEGRTI